MSTLGISPTTFTLLKGYGTTGTVSLNSTTTANKITLLSYIDITRGWGWMHALRKLQDDIAASAYAANVQIIAVVFNYYYNDTTVSESYGFDTYSGNISREWIESKIDYDTELTGITFTVLVDSLWIAPSPTAITIVEDYHGATDSPKPDADTFWYASLVGKDFKISDMWEYLTTPNALATSFDHISGLAFSSFESNNPANYYENARTFIMRRIQNLIEPPFIIDAKPSSGSIITTLNQTKIFFSKPLNTTEAININNYTLTGGGFTGTEHPSSVIHDVANNPDNVSTLTITNSLSNASPAITITVTGLHDTTPASAVPAGPLELVTTGGANVINYTVNLTPPQVVSVTINPR